MIRYEILFFAGVLVGLVAGVAGSWWWRRWLARRDASMTTARMRVQLRDVATEELLDEVSKRDDVGHAGKGR